MVIDTRELQPVIDDSQLAWSHFKPTATGLLIEGNPTYEQCESVFKQLQYISGAVQWWLGDCINYMEHMWGEMYAQAVEDTTYSYGTLADAAWLSREFEISRRRENLTWSHHREVAGLTESEQDAILDKAESEGLTVKETREVVRTHKRLKQLEAIPKVENKPIVYRKSAFEFLNSLENESVDLLLTDPPYMTDVDDIGAFVSEWLPLALAKLRDSAQAYIFTGAYPAELHAYLTHLLNNERFTVENVLVWSYKNTLGAQPKQSYIQNWQSVFYLRGKDAPDLECPLAVEQFAVQEVNAPDGRLGNRFYKWQKPDELAEMYIRHSSMLGDVVIDPFAGSGTFILAAHRLGRTAMGCDIDNDALVIAEARGCKVER